MNPSTNDKNEPTERTPKDPLVIIGATAGSLSRRYPCASRQPGFAKPGFAKHGFVNTWRGIRGGSPL